jgi:formate C-acetyltransferase
MVKASRNYLGNNFRADWSTPSTHLLYGYWVGATPDGRRAREMLNYGVDPFFGDAENGLGFRILSGMKLPYMEMNGGYASHFGINPGFFTARDTGERGLQFRDRVIKPLFFNEKNKNPSPYYLYVNVTTPEMLRKVLAEPKKYAPSGVYIMRIHGTFVNFLDLSPAIQEDIIRRLDPDSTDLGKTA